MIEERCQDVGEHFENPNDTDSRNHPFSDFLRQRRFYDLPEENANRSNDGSDNDRRPDCEAFAENPFVHSIIR